MFKNNLWTLLLLVLCSGYVTAQDKVNVQIDANLEESDCNQNLYCVDLNVGLNQGGSDLLGNSSLRFSYDPSAVIFEGRTDEVTQGNYAAKNFNGDSNCGAFKPYAPHSFDGLIPGDFLVSLLLFAEVPTEGCNSLISGDWATISTICFSVLDPNKSPNFQIAGSEDGMVTDQSGTNFNTKTNNPVEKFLNGSFNSPNKDFNTVCAEKGNTGLSTVGNGWEIAAVLPIPVRDQLMVNITANSSDDIEVKIFDLNGKLASQSSEKINNGFNQLSFDVNNFAAGAYLLSITKGDEMLAQKFIKE